MSKDLKRPNFFVIGVVKGGSTSLYHYLEQHPEIYLPPIKETNHFARADVSHADFLPGYATDVRIDLDAYFKKGMPEKIHIAHVDSDTHYEQLYSQAADQKAIGDVSNSYMVCASSAKEIQNYAPNAKLIVILRNPVRRVWSQYLMNLREAKTQGADLIQEVESDASQNKVGWGVNHQYLELGKYAEQLNRYYALFPAGQIKVLFYESYRDDTAGSLKEICKFLKVDENFTFDFREKKNTASLPRSHKLNEFLVSSGIIKTMKGLVPKAWRSHLASILYSSKDLPSMTEKEREYLIQYYAAHVQYLADLLKLDPSIYWSEFK